MTGSGNILKQHSDKYILIGGTACDIAMSQMGLDFRATKDLDILPGPIVADFQKFLDATSQNPPDLKPLGIKNTPVDVALQNLKIIYNL